MAPTVREPFKDLFAIQERMNRQEIELLQALVRKFSETIDVCQAMEAEVHKSVWLSKFTSGCLTDDLRKANAAKRIRRPLSSR